MKKLLLAAVAFTVSLSASDYSGSYTGKGGIESVKYGSVPQTANMTLSQAGTSLTGTLQLGNGPIIKITSGSVSGTTLSFAIGNGGGSGTLTQNGTQLQGRLTSSKGDILDIVFTKH
jgi:hypothetical protein